LNMMSKTTISKETAVLHRAAWLVPVRTPPISNGGVLVRGNHILAAGPFERLKAEAPAHAKHVDHGSVALLPALVNAHTHLELTALRGQIALPRESFSAWLRELLPSRVLLTPEEQVEGFTAGEQELAAGGVGLYADITNGVCLETAHTESSPIRQTFLEILGFDRSDLEAALDPDLFKAFTGMSPQDHPHCSLAAHACYSTSGALIRQTKEWCRERGSLFSIHIAEHPDEVEFIRDGTGFCRELLQTLGRWNPRWKPLCTTPIGYLDQLGVLDEHTLLVHAVHMTESDWEIVLRHRSPVCFCPRSNLNLNVGRPDISKAVRWGATVALGTDSLASNTDLNLFAEADYVLNQHPDVSPDLILSMITLGGATALGQSHRFGSLEPGKRSALLAVSLPDFLPASRLMETIIQQGKEGACEWASIPKTGN